MSGATHTRSPRPGRPAVRAVVFDLDDTLYPERQFVAGGYRAAAELLRQETGRDDRFEDWLWGRFVAGQAAGAMDALNDAFALGLDRDGIARLIATYRQHWPTLQPFAHVRDLLGSLRRRGVRLGLLSDGPSAMQRAKLAALQLARAFDAVVISGELGPTVGKPQAVLFETAATRLGVAHGSCAYVADNAAKDFLGANRLGWRTIQVVRPFLVYAGRPAPPGGRPDAVVRPWGLATALKSGVR